MCPNWGGINGTLSSVVCTNCSNCGKNPPPAFESDNNDEYNLNHVDEIESLSSQNQIEIQREKSNEPRQQNTKAQHLYSRTRNVLKSIRLLQNKQKREVSRRPIN
jgi:hypothetical protein